MKSAYCITKQGACIIIDYSDDTAVKTFLDDLLARIKLSNNGNWEPADVVIADFKFLNRSAPQFPTMRYYLPYNDSALMKDVPIEDGEELHISAILNEKAYQKRKEKEAKEIVLRGLHPRLGKESSILAMSQSSLYERQLFPMVFDFFAPREKAESKTIPEHAAQSIESSSVTPSNSSHN